MKARAYFKWYGQCSTDDEPKIYLDWYRHHSRHPYKGFSVTLSLVGWTGTVIFVNDGKLYEKYLAKLPKYLR